MREESTGSASFEACANGHTSVITRDARQGAEMVHSGSSVEQAVPAVLASLPAGRWLACVVDRIAAGRLSGVRAVCGDTSRCARPGWGRVRRARRGRPKILRHPPRAWRPLSETCGTGTHSPTPTASCARLFVTVTVFLISAPHRSAIRGPAA